MDTVILIPAYKPDEGLIPLTGELARSFDVVVVDDGSGEEYGRIFKRLENVCRVIRYEKNKGKGGALKTGFAYIRSNMPDCKYIVTADADGQHKIPDIKKVADRLRSEEKGFVIGSRLFKNKVPLRSRFGNTLTKLVFRVLTGIKLSDTQTGLRAFHASECGWLESINGERYEYEMNMLMSAAEDKLPIHEEIIETVYENNNASSHFKAVKDSIRIYKTIYLASSPLKYATSSLLCFALDFVLMLIFSALPGISSMSKELNAAIATFAAWLISSFTNFNINRSFVFKKKDEYLKSMIGYYSLAGVVYLIKLGLIELIINRLGFKLWITKMIVETAMFVFTYFVQHNLIFKKKNRKSD